jgi:hypothetical protein
MWHHVIYYRRYLNPACLPALSTQWMLGQVRSPRYLPLPRIASLSARAPTLVSLLPSLPLVDASLTARHRTTTGQGTLRSGGHLWVACVRHFTNPQPRAVSGSPG